jgi:hypothetical protein
MKFSFSNWTINQKLAAIVGVLGFFALFAGDPYQGSTATIDAKELGVLVQKEVDHVSPVELADWIIQGRTDFRLLDLRTGEDYASYHIPAAENVLIADLNQYPMERNEKIILYSDGGIHSAQAWFLLKASKYQGVYILRGGLEEWKDAVLFPTLAENAGPEEKAAFERTKEVSKFFGGTPQTGSSGKKAASQAVMPKLEMPAPTAVPGTAKKKKKEGC